MATEHVKAMVDYLVARAGVDSAAMRLRCLGWLQAEEESVWGAHDWWFRQCSRAWDYAAGVGAYSVLDAVGVLRLSLEDQSGVVYVAPRVFGRVFRKDGVTVGAPEVWTVLPLEEGTRLVRVEVWPKPAADGAGEMVVDLGPGTLLDSTESQSRVPALWRNAVLWGAECRMAIHEQQLETVKIVEAEREKEIGRMFEEDKRQGKVGKG